MCGRAPAAAARDSNLTRGLLLYVVAVSPILFPVCYQLFQYKATKNSKNLFLFVCLFVVKHVCKGIY